MFCCSPSTSGLDEKEYTVSLSLVGPGWQPLPQPTTGQPRLLRGLSERLRQPHVTKMFSGMVEMFGCIKKLE